MSTDSDVTTHALRILDADYYQREADALAEWIEPHHHQWRYDAIGDRVVCQCGAFILRPEFKSNRSAF